MDRKPLVIGDDSSVQQLQSQDGLDIPLEDRFNQLRKQFMALTMFLAGEGFDLPDGLLE